jgi:hypothetical protein
MHLPLAWWAVLATTGLLSEAHLLVRTVLIDFWLLQEVLSQDMLHHYGLHLALPRYWLTFNNFFGLS